jgi:MAP7 domain-containing protein 2
MSTQPTKISIEELRAHQQAEHEVENRRQEEEDRLFKEKVRRLAEEEEIWKREEEAEQKWKEEEEWRKRLEEAEKEYARQKKIEKARLEKQKVVEMEESREEMEKEPEGSNKKVSKMLLLGLVTNEREIDKI